jgi:5S rRNA maturation endonuclease (ribonuclease M5)
MIKNTNKTTEIYQFRLNELNEIAANNIEELLFKLNIVYNKNGKLLYGTCPIHDGADNSTAFNLYPESEPKCLWYCRTHHCENKYKKTLIGLVRGVLSKEKNQDVGFGEAVNWLCKFCGFKNINDIRIPDENTLKKRELFKQYNSLSVIPKDKPSGWNRYSIRQKLEIPAEYYFKRGYSKDILDKYDVGLYNKKNRIVVPVYDNEYKFIVGFTGRSIFEKCEKCGLFHNHNVLCPSPAREYYKWNHSPNFNIGDSLYNYWFAKEEIKKTGRVILVESPGNLWRLVECGITNCLALYGSNLTDNQRLLLLTLSINYITLIMDNDEAGRQANENIYKLLKRQYNIKVVDFDKYNDLGDMTPEYLKERIIPLL